MEVEAQGDEDAVFVAALAAELASRSDLVWVSVDDAAAHALWHVWHDDAVTVVTGGREQPDPGLVAGGTVQLILRSKENGARQLRVTAVVERLDPSMDAWQEAVAVLHPKRLNAPDGEEQPNRWREDSIVWRLRPTAEAEEQPGAMSDASHRAEPLPTDATTVNRRPFHAGRATKRRR